jgi:hypothetical protein
MNGFSRLLDLLTGNNPRSRDRRRSSRSRLPERKRGPFGTRSFRLEPLEERTLLSFTAAIEQAAAQADPTKVAEIHFTATFGEPINPASFAVTDVTVTNGNATAVAPDATNTIWDITVTAIADGAVTASIAAGMVANGTGDGNLISTSVDNTVTYDTTAPTVTVDRASWQAAIVGDSKVDFVAVFSEAVTGVVPGTLTLGQLPGGTLTIGPAAAHVTGCDTTDSRTWVFHVEGFLANEHGTLTATIAAGVVTDFAGGNNNVASTSTSSTSNQVTVDTNQVTVTIAKATGQDAITSASPVNFTVTFNTAVDGFGRGDISVSDAALSAFSVRAHTADDIVVTDSGDHKVYNVSISGMSNDGGVSLSIVAGIAHEPVYGNSNLASNSVTVYYDRPLTVKLDQAAGQDDPSNDSTIDFTVYASEPLVDLASNIGLTGPGTLVATQGGGDYDSTTNTYKYDIFVSGMTGDGLVKAAVGTVHNAGWQVANVLTSDDNQVTYTFAPTVTIEKAATQADPATAGPINFTVVFSQAVADFTASDVSIENSAFSSSAFQIWKFGTGGMPTWISQATPSVVITNVSSDHKTYTVSVSGMIADGHVTASIPEGVAHSSTGGPNLSSNTCTVQFDLPLAVTINQAADQADPTNASEIHFTMVFNEQVQVISAGAFVLSGTAVGAGTKVTAVTNESGDQMTYDVVVTGMAKSGTVIVTLPKEVASDKSFESNPASTSTDNQVYYDKDAPTVTITPPAAPVSSAPILFNVHFSEGVTGFAAADLVFTGTAAATCTAVVSGSSADYVVAVSGMTHAGTVSINIPANSASDAAGNGNTASATATADYSDGPTIERIVVAEVTPKNHINESRESLKITWAASDPDGIASQSLTVDGVRVSRIRGPYAGRYFTSNIGWRSVGTHTYRIRSVDARGNASAVTGTFDVVAPVGPAIRRVVVAESVQHNAVNNQGEALRITWATHGAEFVSLKVDGVVKRNIRGPYGGWYYSSRIGSYSAGTHHYVIRARDSRGAVSSYSCTFDVASPLTVAAFAAPTGPATSLTAAELASIVAVAELRLEAQLGSQVETVLAGVEVKLADLSPGLLGEAASRTVWIDKDAAGYGWFVDSTPLDDAEFTQLASNTLSARSGSAADQRADLLTTVMHELGHVLGYEHVADGLMSATLPLGARRTA